MTPNTFTYFLEFLSEFPGTLTVLVAKRFKDISDSDKQWTVAQLSLRELRELSKIQAGLNAIKMYRLGDLKRIEDAISKEKELKEIIGKFADEAFTFLDVMSHPAHKLLVQHSLKKYFEERFGDLEKLSDLFLNLMRNWDILH